MNTATIRLRLAQIQENLFFGYAGTTVIPNTVMTQSLYDVYNATLDLALTAIDTGDTVELLRNLAHLNGLADATYTFLFYHTSSPREVEVADSFNKLSVELHAVIGEVEAAIRG